MMADIEHPSFSKSLEPYLATLEGLIPQHALNSSEIINFQKQRDNSVPLVNNKIMQPLKRTKVHHTVPSFHNMKENCFNN